MESIQPAQLKVLRCVFLYGAILSCGLEDQVQANTLTLAAELVKSVAYKIVIENLGPVN